MERTAPYTHIDPWQVLTAEEAPNLAIGPSGCVVVVGGLGTRQRLLDIVRSLKRAYAKKTKAEKSSASLRLLAGRLTQLAEAQEAYVARTRWPLLTQTLERFASWWEGLGCHTAAEVARQFVIVVDADDLLSHVDDKLWAARFKPATPGIAELTANHRSLAKQSTSSLSVQEQKQLESKLNEISVNLFKLHATLYHETSFLQGMLLKQVEAIDCGDWEQPPQDDPATFNETLDTFVKKCVDPISKVLTEWGQLDERIESLRSPLAGESPLTETNLQAIEGKHAKLTNSVFGLRERCKQELDLILYGQYRTYCDEDRITLSEEYMESINHTIATVTQAQARLALPNDPSLNGRVQDLQQLADRIVSPHAPDGVVVPLANRQVTTGTDLPIPMPVALPPEPPKEVSPLAAPPDAEREIQALDRLDRMVYDLKMKADQASSLVPITLQEMLAVRAAEGKESKNAPSAHETIEAAIAKRLEALQNDFLDIFVNGKTDVHTWNKIKYNFAPTSGAEYVRETLAIIKVSSPGIFVGKTFEEAVDILDGQRTGCRELLMHTLEQAAKKERISRERDVRIEFLKDVENGKHFHSLLRERGYTDPEINESLARHEAMFTNATVVVNPGHTIHNLSNTCYINAALQFMRVIPSFRAELELLVKTTSDSQNVGRYLFDLLNLLSARQIDARAHYATEPTMQSFFAKCFEAGWGQTQVLEGTNLRQAPHIQVESEEFILWLRKHLCMAYKPLHTVEMRTADLGSKNYFHDSTIACFLPSQDKVRIIAGYLLGLRSLCHNILKKGRAKREPLTAESFRAIMNEPAIRNFLISKGDRESDIDHAYAFIYENGKLKISSLDARRQNERIATLAEVRILHNIIGHILQNAQDSTLTDEGIESLLDSVCTQYEPMLKIFLKQHKRYEISDITLAFECCHNRIDPQSFTLPEIDASNLLTWNDFDYTDQGERRRYQINAAPFFLQSLKRNPPQLASNHITTKKNRTAIDFTKPITRDIFDDNGNKIGSKTYVATAVILHSGPSMNRGHYSTLVKHDNGQWCRYNDKIVEAVDMTKEYITHTFKQDACLILWRAID